MHRLTRLRRRRLNNNILLNKLKRPLRDLRKIQTRVIVLLHDVPELQLSKIKKAPMALVPIIFLQIYL